MQILLLLIWISKTKYISFATISAATSRATTITAVQWQAPHMTCNARAVPNLFLEEFFSLHVSGWWRWQWHKRRLLTLRIQWFTIWIRWIYAEWPYKWPPHLVLWNWSKGTYRTLWLIFSTSFSFAYSVIFQGRENWSISAQRSITWSVWKKNPLDFSVNHSTIA